MSKSATIQAVKENRVHGEEIFPVAAYHHRAMPGEMPVYAHWHEEAEFLLVLEGEMAFQIGTDLHPLRAGEAIYVPGGDIHAGHPRGKGGCAFFAVVFRMDWLRSGTLDRVQSDYLARLLDGSRTLPVRYDGTQPWSAAVLGELRAIREAMAERKPGYELAVKARLYLILAEIFGGPGWLPRHRERPEDRQRLELLKTVITHIETRFAEKIYLRDLASLAGMSESRFSRFFKQTMRQTPLAYINRYRVEKAAELLRETDRKLLDIALEVGFEHQGYFIKRFREQMGVTPAEYRRRYFQDGPVRDEREEA